MDDLDNFIIAIFPPEWGERFVKLKFFSLKYSVLRKHELIFSASLFSLSSFLSPLGSSLSSVYFRSFMLKKIVLYTVIALIIAAYFGNLSGLELRAEEPRRAVVSMEMALSGDYIVPHINEVEYYNKPPMFNWVMAGFFKIFNSFDEWVVRLPSLLALLLLALVHFKFSKKYIGQTAASLSALLLLVSADILFYGSVNSGEIDLFYALVCYLQLIAIFHFYQKKNLLGLFLVSYALAAIGFLTKGMPSIAFQGITLVTYFLWNKDWKKLLSWQHFLGIGVFGLLNGAYFWRYGLQADTATFLTRQFKEASQRTGVETALSDTLLQAITFPVQFLVLILPAGVLVVYLFSKEVRGKLKANPFIGFSALFILSNIAIYWISGDFKARYYYMFFPFVLAILLYAQELGAKFDLKYDKVIKWFLNVVVVILLAVSIVGQFYPVFEVTPALAIRLFILVICMAFFSFLYFKSDMKWMAVIALLAITRITFNYSYIPAYQESNTGMTYRDASAQLIDITGDDPVYLYGEPYRFKSDASIGPIRFAEVELVTAPLLAYQIPYYISKSNKKVLSLKEEMEEGQYYLTPSESYNESTMDSLGMIQDHWMKKRYLLVKSLPSQPVTGIE